MRRLRYPVLSIAIALIADGCATSHERAVHSAAHGLKVAEAKSIEFSGSGRWFQFGQAPNPSLPWPAFSVSRYKADIDYTVPRARVEITRKQIVEPDRRRPVPVEQHVEQYINGATAWNVAVPNNSPPGTPPRATLQPAAVEERTAEILSTPQGFLKAARDNHATTQSTSDGTEISFTVDGKHRYVGLINGENELARIQTWIDNPVLGDTLVETRFSDYKDFGGVRFPGHIVRTQGGYPVLDLDVSAVKLNPPVDASVPPELADAPPPATTVTATRLADGVYYLTGGTHHSVAIEQRDHIVLVEAPLNEERSLALIAKLEETIPGKPIKYVVNTHAHFDHSGGLRTFVDAGAIIVTDQANKDYYEAIWANPHTLKPDRLEKSRKAPVFSAYTGKHVLSDGKRTIEIHSLAGNSHNDAFGFVYLPKEKILIEADAYTPTAANVPPPANPNPYSVNLYENIQKLKLDVRHIAALHGPRLVTPADLRAAIGLKSARAER
jgi:glyoxylase-like metal-dependent hydrolase (beta-lactamase superfamily II)